VIMFFVPAKVHPWRAKLPKLYSAGLPITYYTRNSLIFTSVTQTCLESVGFCFQ